MYHLSLYNLSLYLPISIYLFIYPPNFVHISTTYPISYLSISILSIYLSLSSSYLSISLSSFLYIYLHPHLSLSISSMSISLACPSRIYQSRCRDRAAMTIDCVTHYMPRPWHTGGIGPHPPINAPDRECPAMAIPCLRGRPCSHHTADVIWIATRIKFHMSPTWMCFDHTYRLIVAAYVVNRRHILRFILVSVCIETRTLSHICWHMLAGCTSTRASTADVSQ